MSKLIIMRGLPASGKSTRAKSLMLEHANAVRVNKDLLRKMLHCGKFTRKNEGIIQDVSHLIASSLLFKRHVVIVDDTNLNPKVVEGWKSIAADCNSRIEYYDMETPIDLCITRDAAREDSVGKMTIVKMAMQYKGFLAGQKVILCDVDGTVADITHRLKYARGEEKNWDTFFSLVSDDTPRFDILQQVKDASGSTGAKVIFVSARPERCRVDTINWLKHRCGWVEGRDYEYLFMRADDDKRIDTDVKGEMYTRYFKSLDIIGVYDDRPSVIRMWRSRGLTVVDVGNGIEF